MLAFCIIILCGLVGKVSEEHTASIFSPVEEGIMFLRLYYPEDAMDKVMWHIGLPVVQFAVSSLCFVIFIHNNFFKL
jgi:hypothetical protein